MNELAKSRHTSWIFKPHFIDWLKLKYRWCSQRANLLALPLPSLWTTGQILLVHCAVSAPPTSWVQRRPPSRLPVADQGYQFSSTKQEQKGTCHLQLRPWQPQRGPLALLPSLGKYGASLWRWQSRRLRLLESLNYLGRLLGEIPGPSAPRARFTSTPRLSQKTARCMLGLMSCY